MPDFYADYPFRKVVLKIDDAAKFCSVGDIVMGMKQGAKGRVEKIVDGSIVVHQMAAIDFEPDDVLVSPTATATISAVASA